MLPLRIQPVARPALHLRARSDLRFIRRTMERAGSFTAVPGIGGILIGVTALCAALVAGPIEEPAHWLATWLCAAVLGAAIGVAAMRRKARRAGVSVFSGPGARFHLSLAPPLLAAAVLTWVLFRGGLAADLPGVWLLMYGVTVLGAGAFSIRPVLFLGLCFFLLGCLALPAPAALANVFMAVGFGGLNIVFGALIARRHGG